jgi:hypothetical protein
MADTEDSLPSVRFRTPTFTSGVARPASTHADRGRCESSSDGGHLRPLDARSLSRSSLGPARPGSSSGNDIYLGFYRKPRSANASQSGVNTPHGSAAPSIRGSQSHEQLEYLLGQLDAEQQTYGVEEHRDGFFDALFLSPSPQDATESSSIGLEVTEHESLSALTMFHRNIAEVKYSLRRITTTRAGIKLLKTCLPFLISYFICLIPAARDWLGRYNFIMPLSAIINHSGRPVGSQFDGALLTISGTIAGLGWGALALYVSTSTRTARSSYGGVLAAFLVIFTALISYLRCVLIRFYQFVICAGIAMAYTTLADTSETVSWRKLFDYGIPFVLGQAISLLVSTTVFLDAGSRGLAMTLHRSLAELHTVLDLPSKEGLSLERRLASTFVDLSDAVRDFTIDFTISRFVPDDARLLRNLVQAAIRTTMALKSTATLSYIQEITRFNDHEEIPNADAGIGLRNTHDVTIVVAKTFAAPVSNLVFTSRKVIARADEVILTISGYRRYVEPVGTAVTDASDLASSRSLTHDSTKFDLSNASLELEAALKSFGEVDASLLEAEKLPLDYAENPELVDILVFVQSVQQVATSIHAFATKVIEMEKKNLGFHLNMPSYPFTKALNRTNAQVRHDRGGLTVGFYFRSKNQLERTLQDLQSRVYVPLPEQHFDGRGLHTRDFQIDPEDRYKDEKVYLESRNSSRNLQKTSARYKLWSTLHQLQGFETRFALKVTIVTMLLSIPAWLPQTRAWWNTNESWLALVFVWVMMHPRVGGNAQDLFTRVLTAAIGAIWAGLAYAADDGNPYVMAVFAVMLMLPMLYRFTQSTHPRSGLVGCLSFTIISLSAYTRDTRAGGIVHLTWTRGVACIIGITAAVVVNWIIWPFIARHELRKSVSTMLLHLAILYRGVVSKYVYYTDEGSPTQKDVERSEMLEGRLREAFVRMRQLLDLTSHEIRLRAPFNSQPYCALIDTSESFLNDLIKIRQFSLYFQPILGQSDAAANAALLSHRRDAVASIIMVMYTLAGALKTGRPLPRYLPSAAAARKRLLDRMADPDVYGNMAGDEVERKKRRWADVYQYAYSKTLTDVVEQLHQLHQTTKLITGEVGFDHDD